MSMIAMVTSIVAVCLLCIILVWYLRRRREHKLDEAKLCRLQSDAESEQSSKRKESSSAQTRLRYPSVFAMMPQHSEEASTGKMLASHSVSGISGAAQLVARSSGNSVQLSHFSLIEEDEPQPRVRISLPPVADDDEFQFDSCLLITDILKEVAPKQWAKYLSHFKREKWTDETLRNIPCDITKDDEPFWRKLMDEDGVRATFKVCFKNTK